MRTIALLLILIVASCTVTKRKHLKGFHIEWRKKYKQVNDCANTRTEHVSALAPLYIPNEKQNEEFRSSPISDRSFVEEIIESTETSVQELTIDSEEKTQHKSREIKTAQPEVVSYIDDEALERTVSAGWIVVIIGGALLLCVLIALTGIIDFSSVLGFLIMILGGLIGLGLIAAFGLTGAFLFGLSVAVFGLLLVMMGAIPLARRNRYKEDLPERFRDE